MDRLPRRFGAFITFPCHAGQFSGITHDTYELPSRRERDAQRGNRVYVPCKDGKKLLRSIVTVTYDDEVLPDVNGLGLGFCIHLNS